MKDLTQGNVYKTFLNFSIPLMLSGLLSQSYGIIDIAIVGRFLRDEGLAAIGATASYITLLSSFLWGFSAGGGVKLGFLFGARDYKGFKSFLISTTLLLSGMCCVISLLSLIFKNSVFSFLKIEPSLYGQAFKYFSAYVAGLVFVILSNFGVHVLNSIGESSFPLKMSALSAVLNIIGNVVAVTVFHKGVWGVAVASVAAAAVVDVLYFIKILTVFRAMGVEKEKWRPEKNFLSVIMRLCLPASIQQMIMYGSSFLVSPFINAVGKSATAAYTVIQRVFEIATSLYQNSSKTVTSYSAQCIGAKKFNLIKKGIKAGFVQAFAFLLPIILFCSILSPNVCSLFFEKGFRGEAFDIAVNFVRFWMPLVIINVINNLYHSLWRGTAQMSYLVIGTLIGGVSRVALTTLLYSSMRLDGVWLAWVLSWAIEAVYNILVYLKWIRITDAK